MDVAWKPSRRKQRRAAARICSRRASRCCWVTFGMLPILAKRTFVLTFARVGSRLGRTLQRTIIRYSEVSAMRNPLAAHPPWRQLTIIAVLLPLMIVLAVLAFA